MNKVVNVLILFVLTFMGCMVKTENKTGILEINGVTIKKKTLSEIQKYLKQKPIEFEKINYYYNQIDSTWIEETDTIRNGFFFKKINESKAKEIVVNYSKEISNGGNFIFLKNLDFDAQWNSLYDVTIIKANDQYEVLKIMNTEGVNYDVTNNMVISKIKEWDKEVGLKIIVAQEDRVEAYIERIPTDLKEFTKHIYELCPDVIDQGYGDMEEMIKDYRTNKYFWMWWD